jgi:uncharacterized protein (TIGR03435 family)
VPERERATHVEPARFSAKGATLTTLILLAWEIKSFQLVDAPAWMNTDSFDVEAISPQPVDRHRMMAMLRSLLAERFHLAVRKETRTLPVLVLSVAKGGAKLTTVAPADNPQVVFAMVSGGTRMRLTGQHVPINRLTPWLASVLNLNRPVLDETGLDGVYDFQLEWSPNDPAGGSVYSALEDAGLKLTARDVPTDVIAVEHAEKIPTAN